MAAHPADDDVHLVAVRRERPAPEARASEPSLWIAVKADDPTIASTFSTAPPRTISRAPVEVSSAG
jgi:hypothetical protein